MPSTATITAFYTFTQNTKARASQVNTNFNVLRGHIIPIDPNTTTSVDNTYDLGSSEYNWRTVYAGDIDLRTSTSTASLKIKGDTSYTAGSFVFETEGVESFRINSSVLVTATASKGNFAYSTQILLSTFEVPVSNTTILGTQITLSTNGRPVEVGFMESGIGLRSNSSTTDISFSLSVHVGGTASSADWDFGFAHINSTGTLVDVQYPAPREIIFLSAGTHSLEVLMRTSGSAKISISNGRFYAREL